MSLDALCSRDAITITRLTTTQGTAGGQVRTFTTAARGSLATTSTGRLQPLSIEERREYGVRGNRKSWKYHTTTDPFLTEQDQAAFTDFDGEAIEARVIRGSRNLDGQDRLWTAFLEQVSNEK